MTQVDRAVKKIKQLSDEGWSLQYAMGWIRKNKMFTRSVKLKLKDHPEFKEISKKHKKNQIEKMKFNIR